MNKDISQTTEDQKKSEIALREEKILAFWNNNDIFKKSVEKDAPKGEFVFYDGPPFATGLPHYGHILAGTIKDVIPRYRTMCGYRVRRRWGWDCHGLPLENEIEKELNLKTKRDIEEIGIEKFNETARNAVLRYADDWRRIIPRLGRFVDMEHDYKTMDTPYTESVWWIFKTLYDKGLIYKDFKSMHLCPRCGTTLSNFEVNQGYKDITDISVYVKLELKDPVRTDGRKRPTSNGTGEPKTFLLVWTTTPWTLPGNMAAAVHKDVIYVKVTHEGQTLILAKDCLSVLDGEYSVLEEFKGEKLVGRSYIPPFNYFVDADIKDKKNAWKIYHAEYVSTEDGTGAVHLAPAFGEDDLLLAQKNGIPIVHHVNGDGEFVKEVTDFAGLQAKPKEDSQKTDIEIIKYLARDERKLLYKKEKIVHSYPHCWRCDTPLLNYASSSWFVRVKSFKDKLVSENKKIGWVPKEVGENRFGKWLEGARDWAISRSRYWGAPLPVWENTKDNSYFAFGSIEELKKYTKKSGNEYLMMRHGEAESNAKNIISSKADNPHHLTEKGKEQVKEGAKKLKGIDMIITSPFVRTTETSEIVAQEVGLSKENIIVDERLSEINLGELNNKDISEYWKLLPTYEDRFNKAPEGGESIADVRLRVGELLYDIEKKYTNKKILLIGHEYVGWMLEVVKEGADKKRAIEMKSVENDFIKNAEIRELLFVPLSHNRNYELDLHRPFIDELEVVDGENILTRVPDVFDCWFESGSMPYAQQHYPFEHTDVFEPKSGLFSKSKGYPADFIAEGMDQTRGWFYSLIVLGTALFGKAPYKHVVVNGLVLAEDGQKMSKRLNNYPAPVVVIDKYGADALRYYLLSSPIVKGEDLSFSEKGVDEVMKKLLTRLSNVCAFYELYKDESRKEEVAKSPHLLDQWIVERTKELTKEVTEAMERYELDKATRPVATFIDDLSTWYIRRSRDRFKSEDEADKKHALTTTRAVLCELTKVIAPFMPFIAEEIYQTVKKESDPQSVHLCAWPRASAYNEQVLSDMEHVRKVVSLALEARSEAGIKVRQPLQSLTIEESSLAKEEGYIELIQDEINVKEVIYGGEKGTVLLDTTLTEELKAEGMAREFIRHIQQLRKKMDFTPNDYVTLTIKADDTLQEVVTRYTKDIQKTALVSSISFDGGMEGDEITVDNHKVTISLST